MEKQMSLTSLRADSSRPSTQRKRSNSMSIMDALGCSTPEAELILAEAAQSRQARRRGRRMREDKDAYRPKDHLKYLEVDVAVSEKAREDSMSADDRRVFRHSRFPSNVTDSSVSTVTAHEPIRAFDGSSPGTSTSPLGDYSANLAKFIHAQLSSIPSYNSTPSPIYPQSCPDLSCTPRTPPLSPTRSARRPTEALKLTIPPIRPPLPSAFSEWSSTDDDTDDERVTSATSARNHTPSILRYYENSNDASFLITTTPADEADDPHTAKGFSFPGQSNEPEPSPDTRLPPPDGSPSAFSAQPSLAASSAPSFFPTPTSSYFDLKLDSRMRDRVIAAATPEHLRAKIIQAISPFEGAALSNIHDVLVESQHRVRVDGMSFDMLGDASLPNTGMSRIQTPC